MAANQLAKDRKHCFALEELGLTEEGVRDRFRDYIHRFAIPVKG